MEDIVHENLATDEIVLHVHPARAFGNRGDLNDLLYLDKTDKHLESQQRIQIAFDIILDDFQTRVDSYKANFNDLVVQYM